MSEGKRRQTKPKATLGKVKMLGRKLRLLAQRSCNATLSSLSPLPFQARSLAQEPACRRRLRELRSAAKQQHSAFQAQSCQFAYGKKVIPQLTKEPNHLQEVRRAELWASSGTRGGSNFVLASICHCMELGEKPPEVSKRENYLRELAQKKTD